MLGTAARFPPQMTPPLLAGQATAGLLVSLSTAITALSAKGSAGPSPLGSAIYFLIGGTALMIAFALYLTNCNYSPVFRHYLGLVQPGFLHREELISQKGNSFMRVFTRIPLFCLGVWLTLTVTISLYSNFITSPRVDGDSLPRLLSLLYQSCIFLIYDVGDLTGRSICAIRFFALVPKSRLIRFLPFIRMLIMVPLFAFLAPVQLRGEFPLPLGLRDALYCLMVLSLGMSNGYICTVLFMHAPTMVAAHSVLLVDSDQEKEEGQKDKELSGAMMGLFLNAGLVCGSLSSFLWRAVF